MNTNRGRKKAYIKLSEDLLNSIKLKPYYYPLGSERELCHIFQVSRPTLRKALELLEQNKQIVRIPYKGTFYIGNKLHVDTSIPKNEYIDPSQHNEPHFAFYNIVQSRGLYTHSKVLVQTIEKIPSVDIAIALGLSIDDNIFHLTRLRFINNELYSLADSFIPLKYSTKLLDVDFSKCSLYKKLQELYNVTPVSLDKNLEIKQASEQEALLLHLNISDPLSIMHTIAYDNNNIPIEYAVSRSNAYNTRFIIKSLK